MCTHSFRRPDGRRTRQDQLFRADQIDFAELSGDFNPVHLDEVRARREFSGAIIVHGIHLLCSALDMWLRARGEGRRIMGLKCSFGSPAYLQRPVCFIVTKEAPCSVSIEARSAGRVTMKCRIAFDAAKEGIPGRMKVSEPVDAFPRDPQRRTLADVAGMSGTLTSGFSESLAIRRFPQLVQSADAVLDAILASTRLVGMKCPGLNSIFSSLDLSMTSGPAAGTYSFCVTETDERLSLVRMQIDGASASGEITAFFRPEPRPQDPVSVVRRKIEGMRFAGHNALVIGGSRGLGEATAKIVASGGGKVMLTFRVGRADATAVCDEIRSAGGDCMVASLDVATLEADLAAIHAAGFAATHIYYFPTPHVGASLRDQFDSVAFAKFSEVYVAGFARLFHAARRQWPGLQSIFYPSSIATIGGLPGFVEYASAKAAGEQLCQQLASSWRNGRVVVARLPAVATDLTGSVLPAETGNAVDVMIPFICEMNGGASNH